MLVKTIDRGDQGERLIGHISRDATEIEARESPVKVEKPVPTPKPRG